MSTVLVYASMSLDGYVAGANIGVANPLGDGGERLHEWMFAEPGEPADRAVTKALRAETAAVVVGRRTFDVGVGHWGDVPYPVPTFVVTHEVRPELPQASGTFTFVSGVPAAIALATAAAGAGTVTLMGADVQRQALAAGLVDEVMISLVPVVLGGGTRLFDGLPTGAFTGSVTHHRFGVTGSGQPTVTGAAVDAH